jgi:hypothetical protein
MLYDKLLILINLFIIFYCLSKNIAVLGFVFLCSFAVLLDLVVRGRVDIDQIKCNRHLGSQRYVQQSAAGE